MDHDQDYVLCECELEPLRQFVEDVEARLTVQILKPPSVCLTMIRAEDSLEKQEFYLGEALTSECEVDVNGATGYGVCLGEEPVRVYCLAVMDALRHAGALREEVEDFISRQGELVRRRETEEFNMVLRTQVDFKLLEQE
jgi:alpha-D-ribose 1-methylphosphonate 5-triphosphate synthase subunit PhnG